MPDDPSAKFTTESYELATRILANNTRYLHLDADRRHMQTVRLAEAIWVAAERELAEIEIELENMK